MNRRKNTTDQSNQAKRPAVLMIDPISAAGLLLILVAGSALATYLILIVPGRVEAQAGPPGEFLAAATRQAAEAGNVAEAPAQSAEPSPTPSPDLSSQPTPPPVDNPVTEQTMLPTENPYGDWPLADGVNVDYWISIPGIGLEAPVIALAPREREVDGRIVNRLPVPNSFSVAWDATSVEPGFVGNTVITGHNNLYGAVFSRLSEIQPGWEIAVWSEYGVFSYYVTEALLLEEDAQPLDFRIGNAATYMGPSGDDRLTLITCGPGRESTHRYIVIATR